MESYCLVPKGLPCGNGFDHPHPSNHSEGEIGNSNGFTTNPIEAKWTVMKRWIRKRGGGVLPKHGDREKWAALIYEYQGRNLLMTREHHGIHHDRIRVLRLRTALNLFAVA